MSWPFHPGELEAQRLAGVGAVGGGIRTAMPDQHREFFPMLPFVVIAGVDEGWPVATVLTGEPGFITAPDPHTLRIATRPEAQDPAARAFTEGRPAGVLGIQLHTRRRNRENGFIKSAGAHLVLDVRQSFGNCPKYITPRIVERFERQRGPTEAFTRLDPEAGELIRAADTFFVATSARVEEPEGGVDVSHRGGPRGFVHVDGNTLTIPDYRGNRYFDTLGNLVSEPRASLLFLDFATGDLLQLQGTTSILWNAKSADAERLWRVEVQRGWRRRAALDITSRQ